MLKSYAESVLPDVVRRKYPGMVADAQRWLKRLWVRELSHGERGAFRKVIERGLPLPERFKAMARAAGLIVEWPPRPKPKPPERKAWGKPKSWRSKSYGKRRF